MDFSFYNASKEKVLEYVESTEQGLQNNEVEKRRERYGYNEITEEKKKSIFLMFLEQFYDFLIIILIIAASISVAFGELKSAITIFVVLIINAVLGLVQQIKAEQSLQSLKNLSAPIAKAMRDNIKVVIPARELVVGDIVSLDTGDYVPADGRLIESYSLQVNESALTGESLSVEKITDAIEEKDIPLGDRKNMVFSGSLVTYGRGIFVVTGTGMETEIGRIANLLKGAQQKKTPLQQRLDAFGKKLGLAVIFICVIVFVLNIFRGRSVLDSFMFAVALAVAAIPEALSSIITIVLAMGTQDMAKRNAIIRKLPVVETLGSTSVICSDKTGTLTQNKMTVMHIYVDHIEYSAKDIDLSSEAVKKLVLMGNLCNDAIIQEDKKEIGDPTEVALVSFGNEKGFIAQEVRKKYPRMQELSFDSDRKLMSTVNEIENTPIMITKGAPDVVLGRATQILSSNGTVRAITEKDKELIRKANEKFSNQALRVLALGYKEFGKGQNISLDDEKDIIFLGLFAMMDPPREEVKEAVEKCIRAGIRPVMITGDHKTTAVAIANELGIMQKGLTSIEGIELDKWTDEDLNRVVTDIAVYARVSPEHKIRIVKAWQSHGMVVAMTGDGVNDAPALKQADVGVAMGITGTDVAKDASDMILTDDNFATIVEAVGQGRTIYNNIKRSIQFLLSGNTAGIISVFVAALLNSPNPFAPVHLLFINLLTDSLPAIALGLESHKPEIMKEKPIKRNESIFANRLGLIIILEGLLIAVGTLLAFYIGLYTTGSANVARTMSFSTLTLSRLMHGFNVRSERSMFEIGWFSNRYLVFAVVVGIILQSAVLIIPPLKHVFEVSNLTGDQVVIIALLSLFPVIVVEIVKFAIKRR